MYKYFQKFSKTIFIFSTVLFTSLVFAETPHMDAVEDALRDLAPGSEGKVWERTQGNEIAGYGNWLLQSPNCWGDPSCSNPQGVKKLADTIYQDISQAQDWIDITTLVTFPDGIFQDSIVRGIKKAMDKNPDVTIRILGGTPPVLGSVNTQYSETATNYLKRLKKDLGTYADDARVIVAGVETSWLYSWNHSKIIAVDGRTAIVGGHNLWEGAYGNPNTPVSDVSMHLRGPAAESAHNFADLLWDFADKWGNSLWSKMFYVEIAKGSGFSLWESFPKTHKVSAPRTYGNAEVLALGGLGFGMDVPGGTNGGLDPANDPNASCSATVKDYYNNDAAYSVANPEEEGLRTLIASATDSIFIYQQDLLGVCAAPVANAKYDARLFDILADKLMAGISVRIITSSPGAKLNLMNPYSNMKNFTEITDILLRKIQSRGKFDKAAAKRIIAGNLQLAPIRIAKDMDTWSNGSGIANHSKVISVDNAAFYIGSKNLYPATLQDFGFIVEDPKAAQEFKNQYLDIIWNYSREAAVVDYEQGICNF